MADPAVSEPSRDRQADLAPLVVIMAHDLKNALAALSANLHFLEGSLPDTADIDTVEALGDSVTLCQVLDHFLRNLDLIGRHERLAAAQRHVASLRAIATDVVTRFQRQAKAAGVELVMEAPGNRDVLASVDRDLFTRSADNLVGTAIEHAPRGSRIVVEVTGGDAESSLTVIDAREVLPSGFSEAPSATGSIRPPSEARQGKGLGVLCAEIAGRAAGGRLERSGRPGECRLRLVAPARE